MDSAERRRILGCELKVPKGRPFSMMQNKVMERVACDRAMPRAEVVALWLLAATADNDGLVVTTIDMLAERLGYARPVMSETVASLIAKGYLERVKRSIYRVPAHVCTPKNEHARGL